MAGSKQWKPGVEAMSRRKFEEWIAKDSTLSASRDQHGYTDITVAIMWTQNWGQEDALRQAVLYVLRAYSETGLEASTQPPKAGD